MKKIIILASMFLGSSIIFSSTLIVHGLAFSDDFFIIVSIISGFIVVATFVYMIQELSKSKQD